MDEAEATDFQLEELDSDNDALAIGFAIVDEDEDDSDYEEEEEEEEEVVREHNADEVVVVEGASPRVPPEGPLTLSQEAVINDDSENVVEDSRRRAGAGEASSSSQGYGKGAGVGEWSRSEIDGLFCPICMEAWTNGGDHQICCLPCGHLYGARCIKKWLQQCKNLGKCPQCNRKCTLRDLRVIYAQQIVVVDHELQKKVQSLEVKCASLEKKNKDWQEKEVEWQKREAYLHLQVHELTKNNFYLESSLQNLQSRRAGVINAGLNLKFSGQESSSNFVLQNELQVDGARLFDVDASGKVFIIARRQNGMGGMHALTKMSLIAPHEREHIQLPVNTKAVRELRMAPYGRLALLASSGKKLSVISMESNNSVLSYDLPAAGWSCSWDLSSSHYIYTGLQNGMLMVFDMRQTLRPVEFMAGLTCNPIHTVHCLPPDSSFPPGVRSLLTASSVGLCQWNFGGSVERPFLIPESENQGVCIAFAYCPSSNDIVASFRPKVEMSGDDVAVSQQTLTPAASMGQGVQGSHVLFKSLGNRCYQKLGATRANVDNIRLPRSAILDRQNHGVQFACGDELTRELVLQEMPSLLVVQHLKTWKHPIRDVRYTHAISSGLLSCLTDDTLQIFTSNAL